MKPPTPKPPLSPTRLGLLLGTFAWLAVVLTLGDPGITIDEPLDVRPGRVYVETLWQKGLGFFSAETVEKVFRDNAEHPPLGRWLLGIASIAGQPIEILLTGNTDPIGLYVRSGRLAPATAYAALVALIASTVARRYGNRAGIVAGFSMLAMPRLFAHAHLGALDTFISYFWILGLFKADQAMDLDRSRWAIPIAGFTLGLALLTKIHAWFLFPNILLWSIRRLGWRRAARFYPVWALLGLTIFWVGWPWLWYDGLTRFSRYLGTGVVRTSLQTLYFGTVYADRDVPWHYPWFYFAATVPIGLHFLGLTGLVKALRNRHNDTFLLLPLGAILLFLSVFSTRVPVYDGERLFLMVFPLWAIFIGIGFDDLCRRFESRRLVRLGLGFFLICQAAGVISIHPFGLSYYNLAVGGLPGAERLGLELTFWNDSVDGILLDRLLEFNPRNEPSALLPTLYPGQGIASTTPAMARRELILADQEAALTARFLIVSRRTAYWNPAIQARLLFGKQVAVRSREGIWLSALYELPP